MLSEAGAGALDSLRAGVKDVGLAADGGGEGLDQLAEAALEGADQRSGRAARSPGAFNEAAAGEAAIPVGEFDGGSPVIMDSSTLVFPS